MADPKDQTDPKDVKNLNQQAHPDEEAPSEKAELADKDLEKVVGGSNHPPVHISYKG